MAESYVTVSEAEAYFDGNPRAEAFLADDIAWYLAEATRHIDALPLRGRRYEEQRIENGVQVDANEDGLAQTLEFPRVIDGVTKDWDHATQLPIVPADVKRACLEEAIEIFAFTDDTDRSERRIMKDDGVKSYSLGGDYSETLGPSTVDTQCGIQSKVAWRIIRRYVGAGIR
jgi:hypothetical protein